MSQDVEPAAFEASLKTRPRSPFPRWAVTLIFLGAAFVIALVARTFRPTPSLPILGQVPAFHLVNEQGAAFEPRDLSGKVWVADFVFTHCTSSCPRLTARMAELQKRLKGASQSGGRPLDVKLVSFSVDPENDTPEVLRAYADKNGAERSLWSFVTGPVMDVENTVVLGFKVSAARVAKGANDFDVVHGDWFVLVDRTGAIRGYYSTLDSADFDAMVDDMLRLERTTRP
jgi:protein SCO1/2